MSNRWIIWLLGVFLVLGVAAYIAVKSQPEPASSFKVAISQGVRKPAPAGRPVQPSSPAAAYKRPVAQAARVPAPAPSRTPAVETGTRAAAFRSPRAPVAHLRSAVESAPAPAGRASSRPAYAVPVRRTTPSQAVVAPGSNSSSGPDIAVLNPPAPPRSTAPGESPGPAASEAPAVSPAAVANTPPAAIPAAPASAVLLPHGGLLLNGKPASDSTALFPGDRVEVPAGSYGSINGQGSLAVLQPGSSAVYTSKGLDLQQGGVAVSTLQAMPVNTEGIKIIPRAGHGKYDVLDDNGTVQIAALEGALDVVDGGHSTVLTEGQQTTLDKRKKAAVPPVPAGNASVPGTTPASVSGGVPLGKGLLVAGGVGGGVAAGVLLTRSSKPVSPVLP